MSVFDGIEKLLTNRDRVLTVARTASIAAAALRMRDKGVGALVVLDEIGCLGGIITERDIVRKVVSLALNPTQVHVEDVMTADVVSCGPDTSMVQARKTMAEYNIRHLPVVQDGRPIGMVSIRDVLSYELNATRATIHQQTQLLQELEHSHPGITRVQRSASGRVVI